MCRLIVLFGVTGWFEALLGRIPVPIASALLAGVLTRFALDAFSALQTGFVLVALMLATYLLDRRLWPRYAVPVVLLAGVGCAALQGQLHFAGITSGLTVPVYTAPRVSLAAIVSLALPLFIVTMASQNLPGVAAIRAAGYRLPVSRLITLTGLATLLLAPFGGYALNLSAITASICMGREAHPDADKRYVAAATCGFLYCLIGLFGASVTGLLAAFPHALVVAIAGFALLGSIGGGLAVALTEETHREAALITFLVTLSGVGLLGIGSAFWGVVAGALAFFVQQWRPLPGARR